MYVGLHTTANAKELQCQCITITTKVADYTTIHMLKKGNFILYLTLSMLYFMLLHVL